MMRTRLALGSFDKGNTHVEYLSHVLNRHDPKIELIRVKNGARLSLGIQTEIGRRVKIRDSHRSLWRNIASMRHRDHRVSSLYTGDTVTPVAIRPGGSSLN